MLNLSIQKLTVITAASFRGQMPASCGGQLLGALQMVHDLGQGLVRELLEVRIGAVLDLLFEQRRISLLDDVFFFKITLSLSTTGIWLVTIRWA
jgi:hypothetical protein